MADARLAGVSDDDLPFALPEGRGAAVRRGAGFAAVRGDVDRRVLHTMPATNASYDVSERLEGHIQRCKTSTSLCRTRAGFGSGIVTTSVRGEVPPPRIAGHMSNESDHNITQLEVN